MENQKRNSLHGEESAGLYDAVGGANGCRKLASAFYARVAHDPVLNKVYPASSHCAVDSLGAYFIQLFGGPNEYSRRRYWLSLREAHARFRIGEAQRDAWLATMDLALRDISLAEPLPKTLLAFFERSSADLINHPATAPAEPGSHLSGSSEAAFVQEMESRWEAQQTLDSIVAAVRDGDPGRALELCRSDRFHAYLQRDRAALVGILAIMGCSDAAQLAEFVRETLVQQPDLLQERYYCGRTLLHAASARGQITFLTLLLSLGADPGATDEYGHTPLYSAANEEGNEAVVRLLAAAGADLDCRDKIKRCAPLHMAARRGNLTVARALLDCGADIEARDSKGETPLRRAVNCAKPDMVAFLLASGADPNSVGSKRLTPWQAARSISLRRLFDPYVPR